MKLGLYLEIQTLSKLPERVERISNKKYWESPVDCPHIFYGPVQGRPPADKLFLRAGTISLIAERKG